MGDLDTAIAAGAEARRRHQYRYWNGEYVCRSCQHPAPTRDAQHAHRGRVGIAAALASLQANGWEIVKLEQVGHWLPTHSGTIEVSFPLTDPVFRVTDRLDTTTAGDQTPDSGVDTPRGDA